jgi:hypothetical protein
MIVPMAMAQQDQNGRIVILRQDGDGDGDDLGTRARVHIDGTALFDDTDVGLKAWQGGKWIGVICEPASDVLLSQLKLSGGLVIDQVVDDSPAGKAGLKAHDILLSANGASFGNLQDLVTAVNDEANESLAMEVLRGGDKMSVKVTPTKRPATTVRFNATKDGQFGNANLDEVMKQLQGGAGGAMRFIGPGLHLNSSTSKMPGNLSISVTRSGNQPAMITVKKNGDTWEVTEDNLGELPEGVRPHVETMLGGNGIDLHVFRGLNGKNNLPGMNLPRMDMPFEKMREEMQRNFQQMFQEIEELRGNIKPHADESDAAELDDKEARFMISTRAVG